MSDFPFTTSAPAKEAELDGRKVSVQVPDVPSVNEDKIGTALRRSTEWGPEPSVPLQDLYYEDTVCLDKVLVRELNLSDTKDAEFLGALFMSDGARGGKVFLRQPEMRFLEASGGWKALVVVQYRKFKQIAESNKPDLKDVGESESEGEES